MGKTERAKALGRHTYCRGALDHEKIHAGMQQGPDVLILDNIKWHVLFNSDLGRALAEGQDSVSWIRRDGERITTRFTAPVIILNNKKCKAWGPNNKAYWRKNLQWVRVRKPLFDRSKTINTGVPPATSPIPPPSSPQPLLTSRFAATASILILVCCDVAHPRSSVVTVFFTSSVSCSALCSLEHTSPRSLVQEGCTGTAGGAAV